MPQVGDTLRCQGRIFGIFVDEDRLEVKCSARSCGARRGVSVFHYFSLASGRLVETRNFKEPPGSATPFRKDARNGAE